MKVLLGLAAILLALGATTYGMLERGYLRLNYPSRTNFPVHGIDVSHHQGAIRWGEIPKDWVSFAYIKASEGMDFEDRRFVENWEASRQAGFARGAYHFFTFCTDGLAQAEHFLRTVPPDTAELAPAVDVEFTGDCRSWTDVDEIRADLREFLGYVEARVGRRPVIYVSGSAYEEIVAGHFAEYDLWMRDIWGRPNAGSGRSWIYWQYANRGLLDGVDGFVDLNVFSGPAEEFGARVSRD